MPGKTVQLTIDDALQQRRPSTSLDQTAGDVPAAGRDRDRDGPAQTDTILAMANWPRVERQRPARARLAKNYAISLNYEPGSTFKVVAIGGALADGLISPTTQFTIPDSIHVADRIIHDADFHPTETLTTGQILACSSNVGAIKIGEKLMASAEHQRDVRLDACATASARRPASTCPARSRASCCPASQWSGSSIGNMPIGQGVVVTPIQMATAYAAIANGGMLRRRRSSRASAACRSPEPRAHADPQHDRRARSCAGMLEERRCCPAAPRPRS